MRNLLIVLLALALLPVALAQKVPAAKKLQDLIIGKWWSVAGGQKVVLELPKTAR